MILALAFLAAAAALGVAIAKKFDSQNQAAYAIPLAVVFSTWVVFAFSLALGLNGLSVGIAAVAMLFAAYKFRGRQKTKLLEKELLLLAVASAVFFLAINFAMFHYDARGGVEGYSTDFGFHKSIISSRERQLSPRTPAILRTAVFLLLFHALVHRLTRHRRAFAASGGGNCK